MSKLTKLQKKNERFAELCDSWEPKNKKDRKSKESNPFRQSNRKIDKRRGKSFHDLNRKRNEKEKG